MAYFWPQEIEKIGWSPWLWVSRYFLATPIFQSCKNMIFLSNGLTWSSWCSKEASWSPSSRKHQFKSIGPKTPEIRTIKARHVQNHQKNVFNDYLDLHTLYYTQKKRFSALVMINFVLSLVIEIWPKYGQLTIFARKNFHVRIPKLSIIEGLEKISLGGMGRYRSSEVSKF